MSAFDEIQKRIKESVEASENLEPVAGKGNVDRDDKGMPIITAGGRIGTVVSKPGTEQIALNATTFKMMQCVSNTPGREKQRYCIVENDVPAKYGNQFINVDGDRTHVVTRQVYFLLLSVLNNASKQIDDLANQVTSITTERDLYKMTIDALKKNGVID